MRRRLSLQGLKKREDRTNDSRRSSLPSPLKAWVGSGKKIKMEWVKRSFAAAAVAVDKAAKDLFLEEQEEGADDMLCIPRVHSQFREFETRYRHLIETLGDLSLAADVDPDAAAALLNRSQAQDDIDTMLALLRAEERHNTRSEHGRSVSLSGGSGCGTVNGGSSNSGGGSNGGSDAGGCSQELLATPCLELLLEERIVKLLCELGVADKPRGTMAMVLGACASLLEQVSHPLLPSQVIHDPISKLVAAAGSPSRQGGGVLKVESVGRDSNHRRTAARKAEEKVKTNLACLLGAIWRELREESALLDFFLRHKDPEDEQPDQQLSPQHRINGQSPKQSGESCDPAQTGIALDVFSSLLPLLERSGRAGVYAREACLVALSVKDRRLGLFIGSCTPFCAQLSRTLTARYLALYDTLEELQAAAMLSAAKVDVTEGVSIAQFDEAKETFSQALSLFLQHLRFCNTVGLVAADSYACTRPCRAPTLENLAMDFHNGGTDANGVNAEYEAEECLQDDVASSLVSQVRQLLLRDALGPALSSALESRARIAQSIAARVMTELSAGIEGYGVAGTGSAARDGEDGCRRQLGPLLDAAASFLIDRECSGRVNVSEVTASHCDESEEDDTRSGDDGTTVREILLQRVRSSSPGLRISTLELVGSLAELRDDRVLLDLALVSKPPARRGDPVSNAPAFGTPDGGKRTSRESRTTVENNGTSLTEVPAGIRGLLEPGGPLEGLRVSRSMVNSFGVAFGGSPIHPNFRRFASQVSLEGYLVEAHQRQIQQLMEARICHGAKELEDVAGRLSVDDSTKPIDALAAAGSEMGAAGNGGTDVKLHLTPRRGPKLKSCREAFDAKEFVKEYGRVLAQDCDAPGSFLHALFDCLEAIFERTLHENVALTGVLSSLCLAATAAEVSPVRRLLLVLLFDGTQDAPFRSMRRVLEELWVSAQARVATLPDAPRLLAKARATLGMAAGDFLGPDEDEEIEVPGVGPARSTGALANRTASHDEHTQSPRTAQISKGERRGECGEVKALERGGAEQARFLETFVFLEEFLKELFCALQAKSHVETDAQGLSESHRRGTMTERNGMQRTFSVDEAENFSLSPRRVVTSPEKDQQVEDKVAELPTSLDEFLRTEALPVLVSSPAL